MADVFKDPRKAAYLNQEGADKPLKSPLATSTLEAARAYRLERLRGELRRHDCAAILLYDPVNIRYALDVANMQLWALHNAVRYALIFADGPAILFEFKGAEHLSRDVAAVDEVRLATSWIYMASAQNTEERVKAWASEIDDLMRRHGGGNRRLAVDKIEPLGLKALEALGYIYVEGQELTEHARSIKSAEEIDLMRWTIRVCEAGMARMYEHSLPGKTEQEIWAELHYENARSGGEWLETRLLLAGPHSNPWYAECSDYVCREGDIVSFDTDMIGPYGYCADLSRSWTCGHTAMSNKQRELYLSAREQVEHNLGLIKAGVDFREFNEKSWRIPEKYQPYRYSLAVHGVGLADEWPCVLLHPDFEHNYEGRFEAGMTVCVESLIGEAGSESIKLETQVLVTPTGAERLDSFPWEDV
jgi:Xaa-Pro aminopeptidase